MTLPRPLLSKPIRTVPPPPLPSSFNKTAKLSPNFNRISGFSPHAFKFIVSMAASSRHGVSSDPQHSSSQLIPSNVDSDSSSFQNSPSKVEAVEEYLDKVIYRFRFMAFLGVLGSLIGSFLCFIKNSLISSLRSIFLLLDLDILLCSTVSALYLVFSIYISSPRSLIFFSSVTYGLYYINWYPEPGLDFTCVYSLPWHPKPWPASRNNVMNAYQSLSGWSGGAFFYLSGALKFVYATAKKWPSAQSTSGSKTQGRAIRHAAYLNRSLARHSQGSIGAPLFFWVYVAAPLYPAHSRPSSSDYSGSYLATRST
ncbi:unnamed protein product [Prunus brigantina]